MKINRWIFITAGILGLIQAAPILFNILLSSYEVLPDQGLLGAFTVSALAQHLFWALAYLVISQNPSLYRWFMLPAMGAILASTFLPIWTYFFGVNLWNPLRILNYMLAFLFGVAFVLEIRNLRLSDA